jgi:hypothetical protein
MVCFSIYIQSDFHWPTFCRAVVMGKEPLGICTEMGRNESILLCPQKGRSACLLRAHRVREQIQWRTNLQYWLNHLRNYLTAFLYFMVMIQNCCSQWYYLKLRVLNILLLKLSLVSRAFWILFQKTPWLLILLWYFCHNSWLFIFLENLLNTNFMSQLVNLNLTLSP